MRPEDVPNTSFFSVTKVIYNDGDFTVALGYYDGDETTPRLAMRWNDVPDNNGFPVLRNGHSPAWFQLPNKGIWFQEMLQSVDRIQAFDSRMKSLGHNHTLQLRDDPNRD